jgi:hypothetical protein
VVFTVVILIVGIISGLINTVSAVAGRQIVAIMDIKIGTFFMRYTPEPQSPSYYLLSCLTTGDGDGKLAVFGTVCGAQKSD